MSKQASETATTRYCAWCGDVWDNPDCESRCCELESEAEAQKRMHEHEEPAQS